MKTNNLPPLLAVMALFLTTVLQAQYSEMPPAFLQKLNAAQLDLVMPLDRGYEALEPPENAYHTCDFGMYSRREKMEIRYAITLFDEDQPQTTVPHVLAQRAATSVASNHPDHLMSIFRLSASALKEDFNADWGKAFIFRPKPDFSTKAYCQLLVLYKEGVATSFIYFLFDDPNNPAVDDRFMAARYQ